MILPLSLCLLLLVLVLRGYVAVWSSAVLPVGSDMLWRWWTQSQERRRCECLPQQGLLSLGITPLHTPYGLRGPAAGTCAWSAEWSEQRGGKKFSFRLKLQSSNFFFFSAIKLGPNYQKKNLHDYRHLHTQRHTHRLKIHNMAHERPQGKLWGLQHCQIMSFCLFVCLFVFKLLLLL